ncbi:MAG TPA: hypothetical protein VFX84_03410, partial [Candidatus Saccharimonadales bacterium]|nr:hypothetical protein [Candidatus Saccharimonadales bacterium]
EAHADCLAAVAREAGDVQAASEAADMYRRALGYDKAYTEAVSGKLDKAMALAAHLSIGPRPSS